MEPAFQIKRDERAVYVYELPEELRDRDPYIKRSIGLVKLKMSEEIRAASSASGNQAKLAYNFLRAALVEVDGRKVNKAEAEDETILEHVDSGIRALLLDAFSDMTGGDEEESKDAAKKFVASRKIRLA